MRFLMFYKNVLYFLITREIIELNQLFINNTLINIECYHFNLTKKLLLILKLIILLIQISISSEIFKIKSKSFSKYLTRANHFKKKKEKETNPDSSHFLEIYTNVHSRERNEGLNQIRNRHICVSYNFPYLGP